MRGNNIYLQLLQWTLWIIGLGLQFCVLSALFAASRIKEYTAVFAYTLVLFVTTITDIVAILDQGRSPSWAILYWVSEFLRQAGLYSVVISLVAHSVPNSRQRSAVTRLLVLLAMIFWVGSFYVQRNDNVTLWMTNALRNLSFCAAIVNLGLWFVLIASERRDQRLLMVTGGLGLQMTGEAIGQSLRQLSRNTVWLGNMTAILTHFLCLYIWWQAFRRGNPERQPVGDVAELRPPDPSSPQSSTLKTPAVPHRRDAR